MRASFYYWRTIKSFKPVTTDLSNNCLFWKQEYPANVLASKLLMTNFDYLNVGKPTNTGKQPEQVQPMYVVFVEKGKWDGGPICYCCGERHEGGWWECSKALNKESSNTANMVGLGYFDPRMGKKWDTTPKTATPKFNKGLVQVAVKEDRESDDEEEETVLPSYTQLLKSN